jgi:hypothetical protein
VVDEVGIKKGAAPLNAMNYISFFEKQLSEISSILSGNSGN